MNWGILLNSPNMQEEIILAKALRFGKCDKFGKWCGVQHGWNKGIWHGKKKKMVNLKLNP